MQTKKFKINLFFSRALYGALFCLFVSLMFFYLIIRDISDVSFGQVVAGIFAVLAFFVLFLNMLNEITKIFYTETDGVRVNTIFYKKFIKWEDISKVNTGRGSAGQWANFKYNTPKGQKTMSFAGWIRNFPELMQILRQNAGKKVITTTQEHLGIDYGI